MIEIGLMAMSSLMVLVWITSRLVNNSGIVDIAWALGFVLIPILYVVYSHSDTPRQWTIACMVAIWGLRLTWHLVLRFKHSYPKEDPRYSALKIKMGNYAEAKMLLIFLWQGTILTLLTAPLAVAIVDERANFSPFQIAAIIIWLVALYGESLADSQLTQFISNPDNKGQTCQIGLWRYSCHPNYFFEWLGSVAFFFYALDSPYGIWTIVCPMLLLHLLLNVSGVKPSEEHSLQSRSDYEKYKKSTSPFVPWFRKKI